MLLDHGEPTNYKEAMMSPDSDEWLEAMKYEIGSMYKNKVWTLVDLPKYRRAIEIKWTSRGRRTLIVVLLSTKQELSQKGFRQVQGVDYDESFSLVSMLESVRIMLVIAAFYEIWQMDKQNCIP